MLPSDALQSYGTPLETYRGDGALELSSGRKVECEFVAGQLDSGRTVLLCATRNLLFDYVFRSVEATGFEGTTEEGCRLRVEGAVFPTNYVAEKVPGSGTQLALRVGRLRVCRRQNHSRRHLMFLLTNVSGIQSEVRFRHQGLDFAIQPLAGYSECLSRLQVTRSVLPTAQLHVATRAAVARVCEAADELCYLLSIALGTKINWITLTESTAARSWLRRYHCSRITKPYGALSVVDRNGSGIGAFLRRVADCSLEQARKKSGLTSAVIDTYLDAKSEGDFLQVRAVKLMVAVEMLKASYAVESGLDVLAFSRQEFEQLRPELLRGIKNSLASAGEATQRAAIYANAGALNRIPFSRQLGRLCKAAGFVVTDEEIQRFVASRNKLIHEGQFYCDCATTREKSRIAPLSDHISEWFWLLHFADRLVLRAINYVGPYIDWSTPESPGQRELKPAT